MKEDKHSQTPPLEALYALAQTGRTVPQSRVVDLLLDIYGNGADVAVKFEVAEALVRFAKRNLLTAAEVHECAGLIGGAEEVESAFAHLLLAS